MTDDINNYIKERITYLEDLIKEKTAELEKAPSGTLRITHSKENTLYYCRTDPKNTTGTYISKGNNQLAALLAQKDYDRKVLVHAKKELENLMKIDRYLNSNKAENVYETLSDARKELITPISLSDEAFIKKWEAVSWQHKDITETNGRYSTGKNEYVRSKSEILIADMLARFQVPYRYEYPINVNGRIFHPDFTALNIRKRRNVIWEHFGLMDQEQYAQRAVNRIETLEFAGYFPGDNLILTFETDKTPLNTKLVAKLIRKYLL